MARNRHRKKRSEGTSRPFWRTLLYFLILNLFLVLIGYGAYLLVQKTSLSKKEKSSPAANPKASADSKSGDKPEPGTSRPSTSPGVVKKVSDTNIKVVSTTAGTNNLQKSSMTNGLAASDKKITPTNVIVAVKPPAPTLKTNIVTQLAPVITNKPLVVPPRLPGALTIADLPQKDQVVAAQLMLDKLHFSPGIVDGKLGKQSRMAISAWQQSHQLPVTGQLDEATKRSIQAPENLYSFYVVMADDFGQLGIIPDDWLERSRMDYMPFESLVELIAEKFHTSEWFLQFLNPRVPWENLKVGTPIRVPNVNRSDEKPPKVYSLRVSLSQKMIQALDPTGRIMAHFPCSIAAKEEKRPVGILTIKTYAPNPNYTFDPVIFSDLGEDQKRYGKLIIPPGPNNPVGLVWIGLSLPGYGIHGTPRPEDIGKTESRGCFRLANWNALKLSRMITMGMQVDVVK